MKAVLFPELNKNFNLTDKSLPFFGKTLLERQLEWLKKYTPVTEIILVADALPADIADRDDVKVVSAGIFDGFNIACVKEHLDSDHFILVLGNIFSLEVFERLPKIQKEKK